MQEFRSPGSSWLRFPIRPTNELTLCPVEEKDLKYRLLESTNKSQFYWMVGFSHVWNFRSGSALYPLMNADLFLEKVNQMLHNFVLGY